MQSVLFQNTDSICEHNNKNLCKIENFLNYSENARLKTCSSAVKMQGWT